MLYDSGLNQLFTWPSQVYIIGQKNESDQTLNTIEHRTLVPTLAASDTVSFWGHDVEPAGAKIGRQAGRLIQGVVGQDWRTLPLQIFRHYEHRRSGGA